MSKSLPIHLLAFQYEADSCFVDFYPQDYRLLDEDVSGSGPSQRVVSVDLYLLLLDIEAMICPAMFAKGINYRQLYHNEALGNAQDSMIGPRWPSGLLVDRAALVQVMMNLLSNAHKVCLCGGIWIIS